MCCGRAYTIKDVLRTLETTTGHKILVEIIPNFVRANDIMFLYGSTELLEATIGSHLSSGDTLQSMLASTVDNCVGDRSV